MQNNDPLSYRSQSNSDKNSIRIENDHFENTRKSNNNALSQKNFSQDSINQAKKK
jgi:hypothetical protein